MGKRELLLISGFGLVGLLVYQLTMPATADTGGGFAAWWARLKSHVREDWTERRYERKDEVPVPEKRQDRRGGRLERSALPDRHRRAAGDHRRRGDGRRLRRRRADGQGDRAESDLGVIVDGPIMRVALTLPKRDEPQRRPRVQLTVRIPNRLAVDVRLGGGELDVTNVASVHAAKATGRIRFAQIAGAVTGELGRGEIDIDHAGSVAIETRSSQVRVANVAGSLEAEAGAATAPAASARPVRGSRRAMASSRNWPARCASPAPAARSGSAARAARSRPRPNAPPSSSRSAPMPISATTGRRDRADPAARRHHVRRDRDRRRHPPAGQGCSPGATATTQGRGAIRGGGPKVVLRSVPRRHYCPLGGHERRR